MNRTLTASPGQRSECTHRVRHAMVVISADGEVTGRSGRGRLLPADVEVEVEDDDLCGADEHVQGDPVDQHPRRDADAHRRTLGHQRCIKCVRRQSITDRRELEDEKVGRRWGAVGRAFLRQKFVEPIEELLGEADSALNRHDRTVVPAPRPARTLERNGSGTSSQERQIGAFTASARSFGVMRSMSAALMNLRSSMNRNLSQQAPVAPRSGGQIGAELEFGDCPDD